MPEMTEQQEPPKIEFPCDYSIRVMGERRDDFVDQVVALVQQHAPDLNPDAVTTKDSRHGRFMSVHLVIVATGVDQLKRIHTSLKTYDAVKMVI